MFSVARKDLNTEATETLRGLRVELFEAQRTRRDEFSFAHDECSITFVEECK
jgi:hypothetical protein